MKYQIGDTIKCKTPHPFHEIPTGYDCTLENKMTITPIEEAYNCVDKIKQCKENHIESVASLEWVITITGTP